jgi:16S rRNA (cytosine967-C5)-methyltransferase
VVQTLRSVFWEDVYASKALERTLKAHPELTEEQRGALSETVYDIIRWWRALWFILDREPSPDENDIQDLLTIFLFTKRGDLTALTQKKGIDVSQVMQRISKVKTTRVLRESLPDWLDARGEQELESRWDRVIAALNTAPDLVIRVNTLKTTMKEVTAILRREGVEVTPIPWSPDALRITEKRNIFTLPSFQNGLYEVQDAASQMVSRLLDPYPGMRVVDACAGEGSKTLHLAALMHNTGKIIALDTQEWRLNQLKKRAGKAGADTIETRLITSTKTYKRLYGTADRLLLDVPCSGSGTLRRNPDIKWKLSADDFTRLKTLQRELLEKYHPIVKPTGRLAYSVCSVFPSEGEEQMKRFLTSHQEFRLLSQTRYWPDTDKTDGFYIALLERAAEHK